MRTGRNLTAMAARAGVSAAGGDRADDGVGASLHPRQLEAPAPRQERLS